MSEDLYYEKERKRGRSIRDMDCQVSLKKRESKFAPLIVLSILIVRSVLWHQHPTL